MPPGRGVGARGVAGERAALAPLPRGGVSPIITFWLERTRAVSKSMSPQLIELVANRFKVLADPARLRLLNLLRGGERTVSELVEESGLSQANASKHLGVLYAAGYVGRRKEGLFTYYGLADKGVFKLCDIMCDRIESETADRARMLVGPG